MRYAKQLQNIAFFHGIKAWVMKNHLDPKSTYLIHLHYTIPTLEGHNYGPWSRLMRIALSAKNKLGFINRTIKSPAPTDANFSIWQRCNDMVLSWILHSLHPDIASSVLYCTSASMVWNDLEDRFS